jgi:hypothetical protein
VIRRLARALALALLLMPSLPPGATQAAEYQMATVARYVVDPAAAEIAVTVEVTFTNSTPNPPGQLSAFDRIDLAIHNGASQVSAQDAKGPLTVDLVTRDGAQVASVRPRARVRYNRSVSFTLSYRLVDGAATGVHVRPEVVKFAAWGFGTSSEVTVELPASYQVRADGDPMVIDAAGGVTRMTSGPIPAPDRWLALVTGSRPSAYATYSASVALASGTVDLQVRAWVGDAAWGRRTLATLEDGLPMLEQAIGLPYPRVGPLVVTEVIGGEGSAGQPPTPAAEIQVAFDASAFTLLHQAAHVWIGEQLAADRWIREGLASHEAERVASSLGQPLPYDPAVRAGELASDASPLLGWGTEPGGAASDAYAYAASWAFVDQIATDVGEAHLAQALRRIVAGVSAYDPIDPDPLPPTGLRFAPMDTRRFLDQLAEVSGVDLSDLFGQVVLGPQAGLELARRRAARDAYERLILAAGDWGAPDPIAAAMADWRFDEARAAIEDASAWLVGRDALIAKVAAAGMTTPDRLRERFAAGGGGPDAQAELAAESAVVDADLDLQRRATAPRGPLETIGLFLAEDPRQLLAEAAMQFRAGDLRAAAGSLDAAEMQLNRAPTNGVVRIASAGVLLAVIGLVGSLTARRRGGSHYTSVP